MLLGSKDWLDDDDWGSSLFISGAMKEDIKREQEEEDIGNPFFSSLGEDDGFCTTDNLSD